MSTPHHHHHNLYPRLGEAPNRRPSYAAIASNSHPHHQPNQYQDGAGAAFPYFRHNFLAEDEGYDASRMERGWNGESEGAGSGSGNGNGLGGGSGSRMEEFVTPSYLRGSRHVARLRGRWEERVREVEGGKPEGGLGGKSAGKAAPHRGVAQEIVERIPAGGYHREDDGLLQALPTRWSEDDRMPGLEILGEDGCEVKFSGVTKNSDEAASLRTNAPMPRSCGLFYFEITILSRLRDGLVGIGFSSSKTTLNRLPGWEPESWAYHGDDGYSFACTANGRAYGPRFSSQDTIGCGINFRTGEAFFTKNGVFLNTAFTGVGKDGLYPSIGIKKPGEHLRANFGRQPFVFDIDAMMAHERKGVLAELNKADVSLLLPLHNRHSSPDNDDDENLLVHKLIGQYLAHEGYVETSRAFARDVRERHSALHHPSSSTPAQGTREEDDDDEDVHAIHRQRIRKAILEGDIDRALKYMGSYYPKVLQDERNRDVYFRLRCRKFVEMMRRCSEGSSSSSGAGGGDGVAGQGVQQMEVDDQLLREHRVAPAPLPEHKLDDEDEDDGDGDEDVEMTTSTASLKPKGADLLNAALQYGQELQREFGNDPRPAVKKELGDVFAIMAYLDPRESVVGGLLDERGRVGIAEGVNGAILVSLGKPSEAALEKVCAQTEALLDAAAAKVGGASGFVCVREDFLKP